jgi:hypothetical protein
LLLASNGCWLGLALLFHAAAAGHYFSPYLSPAIEKKNPLSNSSKGAYIFILSAILWPTFKEK